MQFPRSKNSFEEISVNVDRNSFCISSDTLLDKALSSSFHFLHRTQTLRSGFDFIVMNVVNLKCVPRRVGAS